MEFDKSKVYSAANADELKVGSEVIVADTLEDLKHCVVNNDNPRTLLKITGEDTLYRFKTSDCKRALAYLVEEPEKLKWTDLEIGDIIKNGKYTAIVTAIDGDDECHIFAGDIWLNDNELKDWEKLEK